MARQRHAATCASWFGPYVSPRFCNCGLADDPDNCKHDMRATLDGAKVLCIKCGKVREEENDG